MSAPVTLLLIRHAETDFAGTFCGQSDPPVNARGLEQMKVLLDELRQYTFDDVYTSDLQRAHATAEAIASSLAVPLQVNPDLREMYFGDWENKTWEQIEQRDAEYARHWVEGFPKLPAPNGEQYAAFEDRVLRAFDTVAATGRRAAIVTHGGVLRVMLTRRCGVSEEEAWLRTKQYCGVFVCPTAGVRL